MMMVMMMYMLTDNMISSPLYCLLAAALSIKRGNIARTLHHHHHHYHHHHYHFHPHYHYHHVMAAPQDQHLGKLDRDGQGESAGGHLKLRLPGG